MRSPSFFFRFIIALMIVLLMAGISGATTWTTDYSTNWQNAVMDNSSYTTNGVVGQNNDNFETGTVNKWVNSTNEYVSISSAFAKSGVYSGRSGTTGSTGSYAYFKTVNYTQNFSYRFDFFVNGTWGTNMQKELTVGGTQDRNGVAINIYNDGTGVKVYTRTGGSYFAKTGVITKDVWHNLKIDVYPATSKFSVWMNDTLIALSSSMQGTPTSFKNLSITTIGGTSNLYVDDLRFWNATTGNITVQYNFGTGKQGSQVRFNFTNDTGLYVEGHSSTDNFVTSDVLISDNMTNATFIDIPASAKNQTQYIRAVLKGNTTSSPELIDISINDEISLSSGQYTIEGYVNDSYGSLLNAVSVINGTNSTTTNVTGYYQLIMTNGTYNFTFSKSGYVTNYKEITINGNNLTNQNVTLALFTYVCTATITNTSSTITVSDGNADLPCIYGGINNNSILRYEGKLWYMNRSLAQSNSSVFLNDTTVTELRLGTGSIASFVGDITNITISTWNWTYNRYSNGYLNNEVQYFVTFSDSSRGVGNNVRFQNISRVSVNQTKISNNVTLSDTGVGSALATIKAYNTHISNWSIEHSNRTDGGNGIVCQPCVNVLFEDISITDAGTGAGGFMMEIGSQNVTVDGFTANDTGLYGIGTNQNPVNITFKNFYVGRAEHNYIDIHSGHNITLENGVIDYMGCPDTGCNAILITSSGSQTPKQNVTNVLVKNVTSYNNRGTGISLAGAFTDDGTYVKDVVITNFTSDGDGQGYTASYVINSTVTNFTTIDLTTTTSFIGGGSGHYFIDSNLSEGYYLYSNQRLYNTKFGNWGTIEGTANLLPYYYADINVTDSNGNPINNAEITFTNILNNASYPSMDRSKVTHTVFNTDVSGHTPLPIGNDSTTPLILDFIKNASGTYQTNWTVSISSPGYKTNNSIIISPDSSWYRSNPNTYQNTTVIILSTQPSIVNPSVAVGVAAMGIAVSIAVYTMYRRRGRPPMMFIPGFL